MLASRTMTLILVLALIVGVFGSGVGIGAQRTDPTPAVAALPNDGAGLGENFKDGSQPLAQGQKNIDSKKKAERLQNTDAPRKVGPPVERRLSNQPQRVELIAFAPDGKTLVCCQTSSSEYDKRFIRVLDAADLKELHAHAYRPHTAQFVGFGSDGKPLAVRGVGNRDPKNELEFKSMELFDLSTDRKRAVLDHSYWSVAQLTPDGKTLAVVRHHITLFDAATGTQLVKVPHGGLFHRMAFSADSKTLAVNSFDGFYLENPKDFVTVFDIAGRKSTATFDLHTPASDKYRQAFRFNSPNALLNQRLTDYVANSKERKGEEWSPYSSSLAPDGKTLALIWRPHVHDPVSDRLAARIQLVDVATKKVIADLPTKNDDFTAVTFAPDSRFVAAADHQGNLSVWPLLDVPPER